MNDLDHIHSIRLVQSLSQMLELHLPSLLETQILLCVRKRNRQKNIFLAVYREKNIHKNKMTEKLNFSMCLLLETIFPWVSHA